jgi:hypothetical protein
MGPRKARSPSNLIAPRPDTLPRLSPKSRQAAVEMLFEGLADNQFEGITVAKRVAQLRGPWRRVGRQDWQDRHARF